MASQQPPHGDHDHFVTSRRALLGAFMVSPAAALAARSEDEAAQPDRSPVSPGPGSIDHPVALRRTRAGRNLSRFRYHNAESFFVSIEQGGIRNGPDLLYQTGIVIQLALSSHLLDVGFEDAWCARHLGLNVAKSLACANATGLDHCVPEMERLAVTLSPYSRWRDPELTGARPPCSYSRSAICALARALLDRVREATSHPCAPRTRWPRHG